MASIAWNATLLPSKGREEFPSTALTVLGPGEGEAIDTILRRLMNRKEKYYARVKRAVVAVDVMVVPEGRHVRAVSTMPIDELNEKHALAYLNPRQPKKRPTLRDRVRAYLSADA